jgi:hypothetical protein
MTSRSTMKIGNFERTGRKISSSVNIEPGASTS